MIWEEREQDSWICEKNLGQMRMVDMHAHLSCFTDTDENGKPLTEEAKKTAAVRELEFRKEERIFTCFSAGTPKECQFLQQFSRREDILISFGLHPWHADQYQTADCREYLEKCNFIGEIGMDSVWCQVPLDIQQRRLEEQLQMAADLKKPVILHTKGQEKKIGEMIREFPGKICVHWYSGTEQDLEQFLERDCYFTLGPDMARMGWDNCVYGSNGERMSSARQVYGRMLKEVPAERLFVETDGISAVAWARGEEKLEWGEIPLVLQKNINITAGQKNIPIKDMEKKMKQNLREFLRADENSAS